MAPLKRLEQLGFKMHGSIVRAGVDSLNISFNYTHAKSWRGVYVFIFQDEVKYVGKTECAKGFNKRFEGYTGASQPKKGDSTNWRIRRRLMAATAGSKFYCPFWLLPDEEIEKSTVTIKVGSNEYTASLTQAVLECHLIEELDPPWNEEGRRKKSKGLIPEG